MEKTFKMAWGKGANYILAIGIATEILFAIVAFRAGILYLGLGILALTAMTLWFQRMTVKKSRYEICNNELIVRAFADKKRIYPINKIQRIKYIDLGTDWARTPPNSRHQLAIYFDKKYIKSVESRRFGPEDRDEFVDAILLVNPDVVVDRNESAF